MLNFIGGLLIDISLITGIILFIMSFIQKYKKHKVKMLVVGLILITVGLVFLDMAAVFQAYQNGIDWGKGI